MTQGVTGPLPHFSLSEMKQALQVAVRAEQEAKLNLEQLNEERLLREKFLQLVAHEFRNPLTVLLLLAQSAELQAKAIGADERLLKYLASIERQVTLMSRMLSEFDRPGSQGRFQCSLRPMKCGAFAKTMLGQFSQTQTSHRFEIQMPEDCEAIVVADEDRLSQVFMNILVNAIRYSAAGTKIHCGLSFVPAHDAKSGYVARFEIRDQGRGIKPEDLCRIFDRAYRVDHAGSPPGAGLGLYVAKQVMTHMGGSIHAESAGIGRGATFIIELPVIELQNL